MNIENYLKIGISVSVSLFCFDQNKKKVLLTKNNKSPFLNANMLPSKLMEQNQSIEEVCKIILKENIGNSDVYIEQLNAFAKLYRHPEARIIDIAFYGLVNIEKHNIKLNKTNYAEFYDIDEKPELAFDHDEIIEFALKRVNRRYFCTSKQ